MSAATVPTATDRAAQDPYAEIAQAFDALAPSEERWARRTRSYHGLVTAVHQAIVPAGASVLEIGSGAGDLLAALEPADGVGARRQPGHGRARADIATPSIRFEDDRRGGRRARRARSTTSSSPTCCRTSTTCSRCSRTSSGTRTARRGSSFSSTASSGGPPSGSSSCCGCAAKTPLRNWVGPHDVVNLLRLAGLEPVSQTRRILLPLRVPFLCGFVNGFLANLPIIRHLCLTYWIVARPEPRRAPGALACPSSSRRRTRPA